MENNILPADYAEKLLELESALEEECNMERIKDLNDHYRVPISLARLALTITYLNNHVKPFIFRKK